MISPMPTYEVYMHEAFGDMAMCFIIAVFVTGQNLRDKTMLN